MIPNHTQFTAAIQERKKVFVRFYSKPGSGVLDRVCAPMDYGPGENPDGLNRKGHPVGMVHEVDVLRGLNEGRVEPSSAAKAIATSLGGLIYPKARIEELFRIFETDQVGVVVDQDKIVAIVSKIDVLEFMSKRGR